MENHFLLYLVTSLECSIFITHVRNCVMGATPMLAIQFSIRALKENIDERERTRDLQEYLQQQ